MQMQRSRVRTQKMAASNRIVIIASRPTKADCLNNRLTWPTPSAASPPANSASTTSKGSSTLAAAGPATTSTSEISEQLAAKCTITALKSAISNQINSKKKPFDDSRDSSSREDPLIHREKKSSRKCSSI